MDCTAGALCAFQLMAKDSPRTATSSHSSTTDTPVIALVYHVNSSASAPNGERGVGFEPILHELMGLRRSTRGKGLIMPNANDNETLRKFRRERVIGRYLLNPVVKGLSRLGVRTALATELETIGRKTGRVRRVPVSAQFDSTGAWLISQHGTRSGWGSNIVDNPKIRVRQGSQWRTGIARLRPDDDVVARGRTFGPLASKMTRALETTPISVRIDFID
jgi:deazaflavin-dependent oxidoreductase (nitroreductase family)